MVVAIMPVKGFFISVLSPQGGSGVSTLSIALGAELAARGRDTVLLAPGANYEYYPEFEGNSYCSLTEAYFLYKKGRPFSFEACQNEDRKRPLEIFETFFKGLDAGIKNRLVFYPPFNNFMEIDEINNNDFIKFLTEGFKGRELVIIDTGRMPPFKLSALVGLSDLLLLLVDCRDELYINKLDGFIKSIIKALYRWEEEGKVPVKIFFIANFASDRDEGRLRSLLRNFSFSAEPGIFKVPRLSGIYIGNAVKSFNIRVFRKTDVSRISDEIISMREV